MTWVTVAPGKAVNHHGQYLEGGSLFDADDREAVKWLERQLVLPAKEPAKKAASKVTAKRSAKATVRKK